MARESAYKRNSKETRDKIAQPAAKAKPKTAAKLSDGKPSLTTKPSSGTTKHNKAMEEKKKTFSSVRHPANKEVSNMEVESRKASLKTDITPSFDAPARLLRQTKSTTAALTHLEKGIEYIFQKDFKKARIELKNLLENHPGELEIIARAQSYLQICDREEANHKIAVPTSDQMYTLGVMEHNKADYNKAIFYFNQALEKHPNADYIYYSIAASLALKGELSESVKNLRKAVGLNEDSRIHAKNDPDFAILETHKEFIELVGLNVISAMESQQ
jgi:tetratricopeptide (TPR) repeat protein